MGSYGVGFILGEAAERRVVVFVVVVGVPSTPPMDDRGAECRFEIGEMVPKLDIVDGSDAIRESRRI